MRHGDEENEVPGSLLQKPKYPKNGDENLTDSKGWFTLEWRLD